MKTNSGSRPRRSATAASLAGLALAALFAMLPGVAAAALSNKELEAQAADLDARLRAIERANQSLLQLSRQIDAAREELRALRGQIEQLQNEIETGKQAQRDLFGDLDRRLLVIENGGIAAATSPLPTTGQQATSTEEILAVDEATIYGDAFASLKAGRYEDATRGFEMYLTKYPQGARADNAWYWLGESQYVQRQFGSALESFQRVVKEFPDSRKTADAMLKVGYTQYELKAFRNARSTLQQVASNYPGTEVGRLAEQRLAKMDGEGR